MLRFHSILMMMIMMTTAQSAETYLERGHRVGEWIIGGQPDAAELAELQAAGIRSIINTRRPSEMSALAYDEEATASELQINYTLVATGGDEYPFNPERLAEFSAALEAAEGPVVLHCRSGYRAAVLLAGYLVKEKGYSLDHAVEIMANDRIKNETVEMLFSP